MKPIEVTNGETKVKQPKAKQMIKISPKKFKWEQFHLPDDKQR